MKYQEIIEYFEKGEEGLKDLIHECEEIFAYVDDCGDKFKEHAFSCGEEYQEVLDKLTGYYIFLLPIWDISVAYKETEEDKAHYKEEQDLITKGEKVVIGLLDKHSHREVGYLIRFRNALDAYVKSCEKAIISCQSQLNKLEKKFNQEPNE